MKMKKKVPSYPKDWLYMCQKEMELSAVKEVFEEEYSVEYWEEAGVLEVEMKDSSCVDFEEVDLRRADEVTESYMEEHQIQTVFLVTIPPENFTGAKAVMEMLIASSGGFFCGDTADFTPMVK